MTELLRLVSHPLAARLGLVLVHFVWQGAALAVVAGVLLLALRRARAVSRYAALLSVFAAMALCPLATFLAVRTAPVAVPSQAAPAPEWVEMTPPAPPAAAPVATVSEIATANRVSPAPSPVVRPAPRVSWIARGRGWTRAHLAWIGLCWLAGVVVLSLRFAVRGWALGRVARRLQPAGESWQRLLATLSTRLALTRPVRLMVSGAARVPMVVGLLRPLVVLPACALTGLTPEQCTALLAHELAHLRRHDHWVALAQTLVELLLFYHPAVWWVSRSLRAEREHCCDEAAVAVCGDLAGYLRALTWVDEHRDSRPQPALAASGSPLRARIRRLAGGPVCAEPRSAWLAAVLAVVMVASVLVVGAVSAQTLRPGLHDQWQPQTENDPRLQQPVQIEIIGRAATAALQLLSEQTGVALGVLPEDLETIGDRKLTIIAQGCSLKALLVQIPRALQECHFDVDTTGKEPAYLLHRNAGVDETKARLKADDDSRYAYRRKNRPVRIARVEATRRAMSMSSTELAELEKTDLYLARSVENPQSRSMLELFLSLPQDGMGEFLDNGIVAMPYSGAPEHFRTTISGFLRTAVQEDTATYGPDSPTLELDRGVQGDLAHAIIQYEDDGQGGTQFRVTVHTKDGAGWSWGAWPALWPQYPWHASPFMYRPLLLGSGSLDSKAADALAKEWQQKSDAELMRQRDEKRAREWREPRMPELHKTITLPFKDRVDPVEVLRLIAKESGISIVSDYFTPWPFPLPVTPDAREPMPIWRLLYLLGENWFWTYEWNEAGDCLVFHDRFWFRKPPEVPESLAADYREKLRQQGRFTLDDVVAAAVALSSRAEFRSDDVTVRPVWPSDLALHGMLASPRPALLLYATLSAEQRAVLRAGQDLPYTRMARAQQALVRQAAAESEERWRGPDDGPGKPPLSEEEIINAVYRMKQSRADLPGQGGDLLPAGPAEQIQLEVVFPTRTQEEGAVLPLPKAAGQSAAGTTATNP